jgi:uncharacterized protein (TIGR02246 family)
MGVEADVVHPKTAKFAAVLIGLLATPLAIGLARGAARTPADSRSASDDAAIARIVASMSNSWNNHDARAMCASLADDVLWVNWRGDVLHSRKEVEEQHVTLFAGIYKNTHRTDAVKSIRYLTPELASVDSYWSMTGAKTREGADWPYREGYANYLMAKRDGRWVIIVSHTADFNAKAPSPAGPAGR